MYIRFVISIMTSFHHDVNCSRKKISKEEFEKIKKLKISKNFDFFSIKLIYTVTCLLKFMIVRIFETIGCRNDRRGMTEKIVKVLYRTFLPIKWSPNLIHIDHSPWSYKWAQDRNLRSYDFDLRAWFSKDDIRLVWNMIEYRNECKIVRQLRSYYKDPDRSIWATTVLS